MHDTDLLLFGLTLHYPAAAKQIMLAAFIGMMIGAERSWHRKPASIRTFALMCSGSCLLTILSVSIAGASEHYDPGRIAAQIVTGIGFIGGGVIFKTTDRIEGITTGAMIFIASAIGMAVGFNEIEIAWWGFTTYMLIHLVGMVVYRLIAALRGPEEIHPRGARHSEGD